MSFNLINSIDMKQQLSQLPRRGSALVLVMVMTLGLTLIIATTSRSAITETRVNNRHFLRLEALNAAEALANYGMAEVVNRLETQASFAQNELASNNNPLTLPANLSTLYANTNIDTSASEIVGGPVEALRTIFVPTYVEGDDNTGQFVSVREIALLSSATASAKGGSIGGTQNSSSAYVIQKVQVRDVPLLNSAIFYNMDLELHPGPKMTITGPVYVNGNYYAQAVNSLRHDGVVSVAGEFLHEYKKTGSKTKQNGHVYIKDGSGNYVSTKDSGNFYDHDMTGWAAAADVRWDKRLQDSAHDVWAMNPQGVQDYIPDDPNTAGSELQNNGYSLIEPVLPTDAADYKGDLVRESKLAFNAGLILRMEADASAPTGYRINGYRYERDVNGDPVIDASTNKPIEHSVTLPPGFVGAANVSAEGPTFVDGDGEIGEYQEDGVPNQNFVTSGLYDDRENLAQHMITVDVSRLRQAVDNTHASKDTSTLESTYWANNYDLDKHWNGVVYLEMPTVSDSTLDTAGAKDANGRRVDKIRRANIRRVEDTNNDGTIDGSDDERGFAVQLINGSTIPNPTYTDNTGLTFATNAPVYVIGNFNADGNSSTGSSTEFENDGDASNARTDGAYGGAPEPPAMIAADAITLLSSDWVHSSRGARHSNKNNGKNKRHGNSFTEVAAALVTGLKPTTPDGASNPIGVTGISGGAHNFPRFLQDLNNTMRIRGSLVALFESEVHQMPMQNTNHYAPPKRDWGFNQNFANGVMPPGAPNNRSYTMQAYREVSKAEYDAIKADLFD